MLNNEFPPLGGGTATVNLMLFREFAEMDGLEIDLVTSAPGSHAEEEQFANNIRIFKVPINSSNPHHATNRELITYAGRGLRKALELSREIRYDLSMSWHTVPAGAISLALWYRRLLPYIVRIGGSDIPGHERRYKAIATALTPLIKHTWHRASTIVTKCEEESRKVQAVDARIVPTIIPNGVDLDMFKPAEEMRNDGMLRLVIVARLIEHKGHRILFRAMKTLVDEGHDLTLEVVGTGDAEPAYRELVAELGLSDRVTFSGYVPREDVPALYRKADAFVLPSEGEGMSISTLEAMASGLALVITRTGGTQELLEDGVNGLAFDVNDLDGLTTHLRALANDRAHVHSMGTASRTRAERFDWPAVARQYVDLFRGTMPSGT